MRKIRRLSLSTSVVEVDRFLPVTVKYIHDINMVGGGWLVGRAGFYLMFLLLGFG
jgi:hypothetical protein